MNMYFCLIGILILCGILLFIYRKNDKIIEKFENELPPDLSQTYNNLKNEIDSDSELSSSYNQENVGNVLNRENTETNSNNFATVNQVEEKKEDGKKCNIKTEKYVKSLNFEEIKPRKIKSNPSNISFTKINLKDYIHKNHVPKPVDLSKYILKSQIPACQKLPNMNDFILKSEIPPTPNMNDYIKKNEIPQCPKSIDISKYILKSEIPSCPKQLDMSKFVLKSSVPPPMPPPKCPSCPKCPTCPSPCHQVKKVITCKKQPLVCKPASVPTEEIIKKKMVCKPKIIKKDKKRENKKREKKKEKKNIVREENFKSRVKEELNKSHSTNINNNKIFRRQFNKSISNIFSNKKSDLSSSTNLTEQKNNIIHRKKKCNLNRFEVKKSGVYGPY